MLQRLQRYFLLYNQKSKSGESETAIQEADIAGGEVVVTCCGEYCETIKTEAMSWRDESNGREYVIAAVELI